MLQTDENNTPLEEQQKTINGDAYEFNEPRDEPKIESEVGETNEQQKTVNGNAYEFNESRDEPKIESEVGETNELQKTVNGNAYDVSETLKEPEDIEIEKNEITDWGHEIKLEEQDEPLDIETKNIDVIEDIKPIIYENTYE